MSWTVVEQRWPELRGDLRKHWPRLTPDDVRALGPRRELLVSKLRDRYGLPRDRAERWVELWLERLAEPLDHWLRKAFNSGLGILTEVERAVDLHPSATALIGEADSLSYAEMETRANQLAHRLQALGVEVETPVGLVLERSVEAIAAIVGIWKAGGAYVPLDPGWPGARIAAVVGESGVKVVITRTEFLGSLPPTVVSVCLDRDSDELAAESSARVSRPATPKTLAYVLYTSGSTGVPKGVGVTHANLVHYVQAITQVLSPDGGKSLSGWTFALVNPLTADLGKCDEVQLVLNVGDGGLHRLCERKCFTVEVDRHRSVTRTGRAVVKDLVQGVGSFGRQFLQVGQDQREFVEFEFGFCRHGASLL